MINNKYPYKFIKKEKILKPQTFKYVYVNGIKFSGKFTVIFVKTNEDQTKLGITVTKTIGSAVKRNFIKRTYREIFRLNKYNIQKGTFIVFNAKKDIIDISYKEIKEDIISLLKKANVYDSNLD